MFCFTFVKKKSGPISPCPDIRGELSLYVRLTGVQKCCRSCLKIGTLALPSLPGGLGKECRRFLTNKKNVNKYKTTSTTSIKATGSFYQHKFELFSHLFCSTSNGWTLKTQTLASPSLLPSLPPKCFLFSSCSSQSVCLQIVSQRTSFSRELPVFTGAPVYRSHTQNAAVYY